MIIHVTTQDVKTNEILVVEYPVDTNQEELVYTDETLTNTFIKHIHEMSIGDVIHWRGQYKGEGKKIIAVDIIPKVS